MKNDTTVLISSAFLKIRNDIRDFIGDLEQQHFEFLRSNPNFNQPLILPDKAKEFNIENWQRQQGGGGEMSLIHGLLFEKMGVNYSEVFGQAMPGMFASDNIINNRADFEVEPCIGFGSEDFWASGVSLVTHPLSPFVPPIHMNIRMFIAAKNWWFGGVIDLNPIYVDEEDKIFFHEELKKLCAKFNSDYYERYSKVCDDYFYLPHRKEHRGVGGIFVDNLNGDFGQNFEFIKSIGEIFIPIYLQIVKKSWRKSWTQKDREYQLHRRGRYVEFNLLYDKGIKFGLASGGNPDSMFMSLPPKVSW